MKGESQLVFLKGIGVEKKRDCSDGCKIVQDFMNQLSICFVLFHHLRIFR